MVKYLEQTNETVYLNVGIQVVETKSNNSSIPWTKIGIPLTEKKAIIILNYQAKLGVKKPVKVKKINENRYSVTIPKY
ncbi:MAG: phosphoribosylglycinamide synthetase, partial [Lactococcus lactis]|nr:phosphoribosylglycinamide synthetase [Lactococcus lactis]